MSKIRLDKATRAAYLEDAPKNAQGTPLLQGPRDWEVFKNEVAKNNRRWREQQAAKNPEPVAVWYPEWISTDEQREKWLAIATYEIEEVRR